MVGGVHRKPRSYRSACTRTHFSLLRFGTAVKSVIQEAQYFYSLPERPKLRRLLSNQNDKGSWQKTHRRSSSSSRRVLNEEGESRNNHRYAVVVQDLATQWIQSYPCKTKTSQETEKSLRKFLEPSEKPQVIETDNSLEFGKSCEDLSRKHRTSTPNGIGERGARRIKEGTSAVFLQSSLDEKWWAGSLEHHCYLRNVQDFLADGKTPHERRFGEPFDSDFAADLEDSKSTSGRILCAFGSRTFVPISWMCKKQTSVCHSSTESKVISFDACSLSVSMQISSGRDSVHVFLSNISTLSWQESHLH